MNNVGKIQVQRVALEEKSFFANRFLGYTKEYGNDFYWIATINIAKNGLQFKFREGIMINDEEINSIRSGVYYLLVTPDKLTWTNYDHKKEIIKANHE